MFDEDYRNNKFVCNINPKNLSQEEGLNHPGHTATISNPFYDCLTKTNP